MTKALLIVDDKTDWISVDSITPGLSIAAIPIYHAKFASEYQRVQHAVLHTNDTIDTPGGGWYMTPVAAYQFPKCPTSPDHKGGLRVNDRLYSNFKELWKEYRGHFKFFVLHESNPINNIKNYQHEHKNCNQ